MATVRAKFNCINVSKVNYGPNYDGSENAVHKAEFMAVYAGSGSSEEIQEGLFTPGQSYYLDFTPAG